MKKYLLIQLDIIEKQEAAANSTLPYDVIAKSILRKIKSLGNQIVIENTNEIAETNAKYICLAVNNFEPVLEALKNCREWYDKHGKDYEIGLPNCFIKAKEAINKATL